MTHPFKFPSVFDASVAEGFIQRIERLTFEHAPLWGKMNVGQMLAHCSVTYEMVYTNKHPKPPFLVGLLLKAFVKPIVTGEKMYKKGSKTAPAFIITDARDLTDEKQRLIGYIQRAQQDGVAFFDGKVSTSFGKLSADEWNTMFYKHLEHHLTQFGV